MINATTKLIYRSEKNKKLRMGLTTTTACGKLLLERSKRREK